MFAPTKTKTAALMLAASTLALTALPLSAQEAEVDAGADAVAQTDPAATADLTGEAGAAVAQDSTTQDATDAETQIADDAATADVEADTQVAQDDAATDAATDTQVADDATAGTATDTQVAQDSATQDATDAASTTAVAEGAADAAAPGADLQPSVTADAGAVANPPEQPSEDMQAVLDQLAALGADPIGTLPPEEQRQEPTPADAVMALLEERGEERPAELAGILTRDITYPGADGTELAARVYTPPEGEGPFPLIVYFHGGGWVIAGIDTYDASARALAAGANAVVVSATYRQAPENRFPAAHEDANAAYEWIVENSGEFNADAERLAVAGESAGGNLALNVAIHARDAQLIEPDHMLLVYPVANDEMTTPSYEAYADAQPLSREGMMWFVENVFADPSEAADPRIDLIERTALEGLPPATVINAEIDPLQSEGEILAERLAQAGVAVSQMTYGGVTHEFFGMGAVVPTAQEAVDMATAALTAAFEAGSAEGLVNDPATADAGTEATGEAATDATEAADATATDMDADVTEVEPTAAESAGEATADPMATGDAATTGSETMEMEGTADPIEGEAATQGD